MTVTEIIVAIIVAVIGSSGMSTVIQFLITRHYAKKDKNKADLKTLSDAVAAVAHDSYFRHCRFLLPKDEITEDELENHNYLWAAYSSLGMNGLGEKMHEQILKKRIKPDTFD